MCSSLVTALQLTSLAWHVSCSAAFPPVLLQVGKLVLVWGMFYGNSWLWWRSRRQAWFHSLMVAVVCCTIYVVLYIFHLLLGAQHAWPGQTPPSCHGSAVAAGFLSQYIKMSSPSTPILFLSMAKTHLSGSCCGKQKKKAL